jgi:toxin ParE1/3/4
MRLPNIIPHGRLPLFANYAGSALANAPKGYALVRRYKHDGIRRVVHGNYLIFYHVGVHRIDVMGILHGAMDYEEILYSTD